ncbi:MAG TPA: phage terminase small subunit P27 family [Elusimicrobia bacterium]|nr:phage terminase small subunit P27 family [Elusimicrobiota bacterium]
MGRRGPRPTPTALAQLRGEPGHRKKNRKEPKPKTAKIGQPPPSLDAVGRKEWLRVASELHRLGLFTVIDRGALESVCHSYSRWRDIEDQIAKLKKSQLVRSRLKAKQPSLVVLPEGLQDPTPEEDTESEKLYKLMVLSLKCHQNYRTLCVEFGMTPSSRTRLECASPDPVNPDPEAPTEDLQTFAGQKPQPKSWSTHAPC